MGILNFSIYLHLSKKRYSFVANSLFKDIMYISKGKFKSKNMSLSQAIKKHIAEELTITDIMELYPDIPTEIITKIVNNLLKVKL